MPGNNNVHVAFLRFLPVLFTDMHPYDGAYAGVIQTFKDFFCALCSACHIDKNFAGLSLFRAEHDFRPGAVC